jgi:hypothetical protein
MSLFPVYFSYNIILHNVYWSDYPCTQFGEHMLILINVLLSLMLPISSQLQWAQNLWWTCLRYQEKDVVMYIWQGEITSLAVYQAQAAFIDQLQIFLRPHVPEPQRLPWKRACLAKGRLHTHLGMCRRGKMHMFVVCVFLWWLVTFVNTSASSSQPVNRLTG